MNEQRLIDLEIKFSHQDVLLEKLQQTVHDQYIAIEKLEKSLKAIADRLKSATEDGSAPANEKPPHY